MIRRADSMDMLRRFVQKDLFAVRICALARAYGFTYDFVSFYVQQLDGRVTAILSDLEGDLTVSALPSADREELAAFVQMRAHRSVLSDTAFSLPGTPQTGPVMLHDGQSACKQPADVLQTPDLTQLFTFMAYDRQDFAPWYADLNHRIRHGCARAFALVQGGQIASAGVLAFIDGDAAVLTSVRTLPSLRRQGLGGRLVRGICAAFGGQIYLMCETSLEPFYLRLGFQKTEDWRMFL